MSYFPTARPCYCGSGEIAVPVHDGYGIYMTSVCSRCRIEKLRGFRADIFERYDTDEPIDADLDPYNDADLYPSDYIAGCTDEFYEA